MEPVSVSRHNRKQVLKNLYGGLRNEKPKAPRFKIGDIVRINKQKLHFEKGYEQNWRRELFVVFEIVQRIPIVYTLLKTIRGAHDFNKITVKFDCAVFSFRQGYLRMSQQRDLPESPMAWRVIGRLDSGQTQRSVADAVGVARSVVAKLWNRFKKQEMLDVDQGAGRPRHYIN
ncbi:hypothetical protein TNCV_845461 [Trichonephila clavipes]|uniref:Uncharacterized protein n=1 Tax=Trichonephila clavipes TaxID=2585209 RepID=A0A8X6WJB2_TRICX|nr:hypothetical protein TNCV_845461 [Trichonephila clavipes]